MDKLIHIDLGNVGDLAKPATALIEKIFEATGIEARKTRQIAQAEVDAEVIRTKGNFEIAKLSILETRSLNRLLSEESRKQLNLETIIAGALPLIGEQAKPEEVENDWLTHCLDKARLISDEGVQEIWSRLIAGEANKPGEFSKRSVDTLFLMSRRDAELFTKLCSFVIDLKGIAANSAGDYRTPVISKDELANPIFNNNGVGSDELVHLENIGLIYTSPIGNFPERNVVQAGYVSYCGTRLNIKLFFSPEQRPLDYINLGNFLFTQVGRELEKLVSPSPVEGFLKYIKEFWEPYVAYRDD